MLWLFSPTVVRKVMILKPYYNQKTLCWNQNSILQRISQEKQKFKQFQPARSHEQFLRIERAFYLLFFCLEAPYSSDLAWSDFLLYLYLKGSSAGQLYNNNDNIKIGCIHKLLHSVRRPYRNWYPVMKNASILVEIMLKNSLKVNCAYFLIA